MLEPQRLAVTSLDDIVEMIDMVSEVTDSSTDKEWMTNWLSGEQKAAQRKMQLSVPTLLRDWASDVYTFTRELEADKKRGVETLAQHEFSVAKVLKPASNPWAAGKFTAGRVEASGRLHRDEEQRVL